MKLKIVPLLLVLFILGGCGFFSPKEMFRNPEIPKQYSSLLRAIEQIQGDDLEYAETESGFNRQALQLMDLDGDGVDEGIAFMRNISDSYKVYIYVLKQNKGEFELLDAIEGPQDAIYTVSYANLLGVGNFEMIVEWGAESLKEHQLGVYRITEDGAEKILDIMSEKYTVSDIDQNGRNDLVTVCEEGGCKFADVYSASSGRISRISHIKLSDRSGEVLRMRCAGVSGGQNGVYIESAAHHGGVITNLITIERGKFLNVLPNGSECSVRTFCEDVNGDGIMEMPITLAMEEEQPGLNKCYNWGIYIHGREIVPAAFTYHSFLENWYLTMPTFWSGTVTAERTTQRPGQIAVDFYASSVPALGFESGSEVSLSEKHLFTVYVFTDELRSEIARQAPKFVLYEREDMVFAAEIYSDEHMNTVIDEELIKNAFKIRESEWISDISFA